MAKFTIEDLEIERSSDELEFEMRDGTVFAFRDPKALQLSDALHLESLPRDEQVRTLIAGDRFDEFAAHPDVDLYLFEAVVKKYIAHYGLTSLGEGLASPL